MRTALIFVTSNRHKFEEAREILGGFGIEVEMISLEYPELQADLEDVARYGARYCANILGRAVIVEDSGLFIEALGGFPGPYSSYVYKTIGCEGILKLMDGVSDRRAYFKSVVGYCEPGKEPVVFSGIVRGRISNEIKGSGGFGYDPIFVPEGYDRTFAEDTKLKNRISHRRRALEKFAEWWVSEHGKDAR